jgi:hypothetical protein
MYSVPPAGRWWHVVGAPLEQGVRPCGAMVRHHPMSGEFRTGAVTRLATEVD